MINMYIDGDGIYMSAQVESAKNRKYYNSKHIICNREKQGLILLHKEFCYESNRLIIKRENTANGCA